MVTILKRIQCLYVDFYFSLTLFEIFWLTLRVITGTSYTWQLKYNLEILIPEFCISDILFFHSVTFWKVYI